MEYFRDVILYEIDKYFKINKELILYELKQEEEILF